MWDWNKQCWDKEFQDWDENVTSVKSNVNNMDAKEMETLLGEQLAHALIATNNNQMESWLNKRKQCG